MLRKLIVGGALAAAVLATPALAVGVSGRLDPLEQELDSLGTELADATTRADKRAAKTVRKTLGLLRKPQTSQSPFTKSHTPNSSPAAASASSHPFPLVSPEATAAG